MTTPLRQKMIEDMQLHGFAARTQEAYLLAVSQLARHYHKSPDQINEEELRQYFLFLTNEKHAARSTCTIALCGIKFFFERTLDRQWKTLDFLRPLKEKKLPAVLSQQEVARLLSCIHIQEYRVCLTLIYSCGLRLLEGVRLQVKDIDGNRKMLHVCLAKGGKDRYVPLPEASLEMLRRHWQTHRNRVWLFPALRGDGSRSAEANGPMCETGVQRALHAALIESSIHKKVTVHT
jgi:integrase/recombinase XerD